MGFNGLYRLINAPHSPEACNEANVMLTPCSPVIHWCGVEWISNIWHIYLHGQNLTRPETGTAGFVSGWIITDWYHILRLCRDSKTTEWREGNRSMCTCHFLISFSLHYCEIKWIFGAARHWKTKQHSCCRSEPRPSFTSKPKRLLLQLWYQTHLEPGRVRAPADKACGDRWLWKSFPFNHLLSSALKARLCWFRSFVSFRLGSSDSRPFVFLLLRLKDFSETGGQCEVGAGVLADFGVTSTTTNETLDEWESDL